MFVILEKLRKYNMKIHENHQKIYYENEII